MTGVVGTGFHIYNIGKRPGGFCWQNLFYAAPIGAPAAISLSGMMGFLAERVRDNAPGTVPTVSGLPAGRVVAALTGVGLLGTAAEAGLLHFRGAFHNPAMLLPVTVPPGGGRAAGRGGARRGRAAAALDALVAALHRAAGRRRRRLPRDRRRAQHGRLAQLDAEHPGRPADAGAARLHRSGAGRAWPPWACCRTIPMTERITTGRYPGYDVLSKRDTPVLERQDARGDRRAAGGRSRARHSFPPSEWRTLGGALRPRDAAAAGPAARAARGLCGPADAGRED